MALLEGLIDEALGDADVKGVIITSGKDSFAGGMDLNVIAKMKEMKSPEVILPCIASEVANATMPANAIATISCTSGIPCTTVVWL